MAGFGMTGQSIHSIGHSARKPAEFVELLLGAGVKTLVDVRREPHSRRNPGYNVDALNKVLFRGGVRYTYLGDQLGGRRSARSDSPHVGLAGSAFQGYADHMQTPIFARGYAQLCARGAATPTAFMCAERNPKRCHRRLLSDRLVVDGWRVVHVLDADRHLDHKLDSGALVIDGRLVYRPAALEDFS